MPLTAREIDFLTRRRRHQRLWPWVGAGLGLMLLTYAIAVWWRVPLLINPWAAVAALEADSIERGTLYLMAMMLPMAMLMLLVIMGLLLLFITVSLRNEKRIIDILDRLEAAREPSTPE